MSDTGDEQRAGKWTDETLSMSQRHELLAQELARVAHKPRAVGDAQQRAGNDGPAADAAGEQHAG